MYLLVETTIGVCTLSIVVYIPPSLTWAILDIIGCDLGNNLCGGRTCINVMSDECTVSQKSDMWSTALGVEAIAKHGTNDVCLQFSIHEEGELPQSIVPANNNNYMGASSH